MTNYGDGSKPKISLEKRYQQIWQEVLKRGALPKEKIKLSRKLFKQDKNGNLLKSKGEPVPKNFEVYTMLIGLPFPKILIDNLQKVAEKFKVPIIGKIPLSTEAMKSYAKGIPIMEHALEHDSTDPVVNAFKEIIGVINEKW